MEGTEEPKEMTDTDDATRISGVISSLAGEDLDVQANGLESLGTWTVDQDDLERDVAKKAEDAMAERDEELDQKRLDKTKAALEQWTKSLERLEQKLKNPRTRITEKEKIREQIKDIENIHVKGLNEDLKDIRERIRNRKVAQQEEITPITSGRLSNETQHDFLVRTGKITPFSNTYMASSGSGNTNEKASMSHQQLRLPGMELDEMSDQSNEVESDENEQDFLPDDDLEDLENDIQDLVDEDESFELSDVEVGKKRKKQQPKKASNRKKVKAQIEDLKGLDDGNELAYQTRLSTWVAKREAYRAHIEAKKIKFEETGEPNVEDSRKEWEKPHPLHEDVKFDNQFKMPGDIHTSLFDYQKTGVQWLWELYSQKVGGIIGDEMGLGKTIQIVAFIAGLHYSGLLDKPVIIVCPATVMRQWVNEFHRWWPALRVVILHSIGSGMDYAKELSLERSLENSERGSVSLPTARKETGAASIVNTVMEKGKHIFFIFIFFY